MSDVAPSPPPVAARGLEPGTMVDHFKVMRLLGQGGMGEVYLARDSKLGRKVALKLLRAQSLGSEEAVQLFLREARTTARFSHPHIVTIYAVGEGGPDNEPYVALEYLEGQTLRERLADRPTIGEALRIGLAIAQALEEAHANEILHRDLKPENVMLPKDGRLRVLDFGLAKTFERDPRGEALDATLPAEARTASVVDLFQSKAGQITGTPRYMAPEQWRGQETSGATDLWALGLILYELVAGRHPFEGAKVMQLALRVADDEPIVAPEVDAAPDALLALIEACLRKNAAQRPRAAEVVQELAQLVSTGRQRRSGEESPFRGLATFGPEHANLFFGREAEISAFVERLRTEPVLPVVGPSGAGKSSFVQAGVIPRLAEQRRLLVLQLRPGRHPERALAARLAAPQLTSLQGSGALTGLTGLTGLTSGRGRDASHRDPAATEELAAELLAQPGRLALELRELAERERALVLLFVDQLEELYTLDERAEARQAFLSAVCSAADDPQEPVRVIFTLRDDFLGRLKGGPAVREALNRVTVLAPPGAAALEEILLQPVAAVGYRYDDPELVREMITAVEGELSALPLLQFACRLLWERRDKERKLLLRAVYDELGGVAGALARHADSVLSGMSAEQVRLARTLLLRLVTPEGTRQVLFRSELLEGLDDGAVGVLDRLIDARLVTQRKAREERTAQLELTHGSLIHGWDRLARWLDESKEELAFRAELEQAAELWERRGSRVDEAWQGGALAEARHMLEHHHLEVSARSRLFLAAGDRRERRRTLRRWTLVAAGFTLLAGIALTFFLKERETARAKTRVEQERQLAQTQRARAERNRARAELEGARAAYFRGDLLEARAKLRRALETASARLGRALWAELVDDPRYWRRNLGSPMHAVRFSPDGLQVAAAGQDRAIYLLSLRTTERRVLRGHRDQVRSLAYSPGGRRLASGTWSGQIYLWNLARGTRRELRGHTAAVVDLAFSPDGKRLASASWDRSLRSWSLGAQQDVRVLRGHGERVSSVDFSPDGRTLASAGLDGTVRLWDAVTGQAGLVLPGHRGGAVRLEFSPVGQRLASVGIDRVVRLWRTTDGKLERVFAGPGSPLWDVVFSQDGKLLITGGLGGALWVFGVDDGQRWLLQGHRGAVYSLSASRRGPPLVASSGVDNTVRVWRLRRPRERTATFSPVWGVAFGKDGKQVFAGARDHTLRRWRVADGGLEGIHAGHTSTVISVAVSPDGALVATGGGDGTVRLWSSATGAAIEVLLGHRADVFAVAFSKDGKLLASAGADKTVRLWDVGSRQFASQGRRGPPPLLGGARGPQALKVLRGFGGAVWDVAFSPDGQLLAASNRDRVLRLFDPRSGRLVRELRGHEAEAFGLAFSPDGRTLASGSADGTLRLWDVATGRGRVLAKLGGRFYFVDFHPSGRWVAASGSDGTPRIFDVKTSVVLALHGHRGEANYLRFSRDGKLLATSGDDGTVRLWSVPGGRPFWHAPGIVPAPARLFSHRGWQALEGRLARPRESWRSAVENARQVAGDASGTKLCLVTFQGTVELWDRRAERRLFSDRFGRSRDLLALADGCVVLGAKDARHYVADGSYRPLGAARAIAPDGLGFLLVAAQQVGVYGADGRRQRSIGSIDPGVTALTRVGDRLILGFENGSIELASTSKAAAFACEKVPASAVVRLLPGPQGTLIAGFANGLLGLWSLDSGLRLAHAYVHGPARHLLLHQRRLLAASVLGDVTTVDLQAFYVDDCTLLRDVWREVPMVWADGKPVVQPPPATHRCARERGVP